MKEALKYTIRKNVEAAIRDEYDDPIIEILTDVIDFGENEDDLKNMVELALSSKTINLKKLQSIHQNIKTRVDSLSCYFPFNEHLLKITKPIII